MNRTNLLLAAGIGTLGVLSALPSASADPFLPVPPASFLNYHVSTARGLSEEVAQDVVVRARLARHFGMSGPAVCDYVRRNLVETTLTASQAGRYRVACISPSGREYYVTERLNAGTPVFALAATGQPVLKLECGNPLVASLPVVESKAMTAPRPAGPPVMVSDPTAVPGQTVVASSTIPGEETFTAASPLTDYEFTGAGPIINVEPFPATLLTHGGGFGFLPGLLAGAALFGLSTGHGGGGSSNVAPPPAPEPGTPVVLACGALALASLGLRASRRRGAAS
jgi:hypothetical protein